MGCLENKEVVKVVIPKLDGTAFVMYNSFLAHPVVPGPCELTLAAMSFLLSALHGSSRQTWPALVVSEPDRKATTKHKEFTDK